jgi:hypothetical protein
MRLPSPTTPGRSTACRQRPDASRAAAWRAELSRREQELFEAVAGDALRLLGYPRLFRRPRRAGRSSGWARGSCTTPRAALGQERASQTARGASGREGCPLARPAQLLRHPPPEEPRRWPLSGSAEKPRCCFTPRFITTRPSVTATTEATAQPVAPNGGISRRFRPVATAKREQRGAKDDPLLPCHLQEARRHGAHAYRDRADHHDKRGQERGLEFRPEGEDEKRAPDQREDRPAPPAPRPARPRS